MFNAIVTPWIDEGTDWVGISSIIHNTGLEPITLRTNQPVGSASVVTNMDQGPQLLQTTATTEAEPNEYSSLTMAAIQEQIVEGKQFRLPEGDWRKGQTGRQVINHIKQSPEMTTEFQLWHTKWYEKIRFGERLTQLQRTELAMILFAFNSIKYVM